MNRCETCKLWKFVKVEGNPHPMYRRCEAIGHEPTMGRGAEKPIAFMNLPPVRRRDERWTGFYTHQSFGCPYHQPVEKQDVFKYTLQDLVYLRDSLRVNEWIISSGLSAFRHSRQWPGGFHWVQYIEFSEKIIADHDFPEKHFATKT